MPLPPLKKKKVHAVTDADEVRMASVSKDGRVTGDDGHRDEEEQDEPTERMVLDGSSVEQEIRKLLKMSTFEPQHRYWLDTGSEQMNATLGSRRRGLAYGKMYEIRGKNHGGKTALTTCLAGMAQRDNAGVGYIDLEESRDFDWAAMLSLNLKETVKIYPKLIHDNKTSPPRLESAEEIFAETEAGMQILSKRGYEKQFWFMDSVANLVPAMVIEKGVTGQNMRTKNELAQFLSLNLKRWTGLAANYNATIILINQIRVNPGQMFGDPEYSPGGNSFQHTCACRATVRRVKHGRLRQGDKVVGLVGLVTNFKNKVGKGSVQDEQCAFAIRWRKTPARCEFMTKDEAEELMK